MTVSNQLRLLSTDMLRLQRTRRLFATLSDASSASPSSSTSTSARKRRLDKPTLTLDQFIQRRRVLGLWREILRDIHRIPKSPTRTELLDYARTEFKRNKTVQDTTQIRYLLSTGRSEYEGMKRYIDQLAMS
ncbi:hypothetical protein VTN49DRAFT_3903 [Thermomyces lanuginosus]|uniref:uncharacterized protein n=1 Tax=Thermomyces lanuginosus TaxID=5541 RepID=UPI003742552B